MPATSKRIVSQNQALLDLIEGAEQVEVKEVPVAADRAQGEPMNSERAFMVRIKANGKKKTKPITVPQSHETQHSRAYLLKNAQVLLRNADYLLARNIYSQLLTEDIRDPEALYGLGICLFKLGDRTASRKCFKALWELHRREEALIWIGRSYVKEGKDKEAAEAFARVGENLQLGEKDQFLFLKEYGNCLLRLGSYAEANSIYQRAKAINPQSDAIYVNLGMLDFHCGRLSSAKSHFLKALKLNPMCSKSYSGLGLVAMAEKQISRAEKRFLEALNIESDNQVAILQLVVIAYQSESYVEVQRRIEAFLTKDPKNVSVRYAYAGILFKCGNWKECHNQIDSILKMAPHHEKAKQLKATLSETIRR